MAKKTVPVRVISAHADFSIDQVVNIDAAQVDGAVAAGWADPHPDAVAYARSLPGSTAGEEVAAAAETAAAE